MMLLHHNQVKVRLHYNKKIMITFVLDKYVLKVFSLINH